MNETNFSVRMRFMKTDRAKYISHLDLMRCLQRAVCRAALPAAYSNGFHPRMQLSFATTLPLGFTSIAEIMQLDLSEPLPFPDVQQRLNTVLPTGLKILEANAPRFPFPTLSFGDYQIVLSNADPAQLSEKLYRLLAEPTLVIEKKTKKGQKQVDIRPGIELLSCETQSAALVLQMRFPTGNQNVNPLQFLKLIESEEEIIQNFPKICRIQLWKSANEKFF